MNEKRILVNELHHSARKNFSRVPFQMRGVDDTFQIDLIEFIPYAKENKGFKYALVVIDVFFKICLDSSIEEQDGYRSYKSNEISS